MQFVLQHLQGHVVHHQVMEQQQGHHSLVHRVGGMHQAQQRRLGDVQAVATAVEARLQLAQHLAVARLQGDLFAAQRRLAPDHLQRLLQAFPEHRAAQDVIAFDHPLQGLGEGLQALGAGKGELRLQHVGVTRSSRQMVEQDAGLQRRQR
ncbi:hypothetical protein BME99_11085 [Pseudomonas protegens]|nr:hypothetical protein BME99_11085 [Pseudomonas protegens]